jgi:hypothetical protein
MPIDGFANPYRWLGNVERTEAWRRTQPQRRGVPENRRQRDPITPDATVGALFFAGPAITCGETTELVMTAAQDPLFADPPPAPGAAPAHVAPRPSWWRRLLRRDVEWDPTKDRRAPRWRWLKRGALAIAILLLLYYPVGMVLLHRIGDDTRFESSPAAATGQSRAVAILGAVIDREVNRHRWTPNDPFFVPSAALDNLPNFQRGIQAGAALVIVELRDKLARTRGSSSVDADLQEAASRINTSTDQWIWNPRVSLMPQSQAEQHYRETIRRLVAYNKRLIEDKAVFERRADNLQALIDRINADLGSQSALIADRVIREGDRVFDTQSDNIFYQTKGRLYVYYLVLRELAQDFDAVLGERQLKAAWSQMLISLEHAAKLQPLIVRNGRADSMIMPSHLAAQGFFLLRARVQLKEIHDVLLR